MSPLPTNSASQEDFITLQLSLEQLEKLMVYIYIGQHIHHLGNPKKQVDDSILNQLLQAAFKHNSTEVSITDNQLKPSAKIQYEIAVILERYENILSMERDTIRKWIEERKKKDDD